MDYVPAKILSKQSSIYSPTAADAMSGYALAVRHDRLDYSMTKGGLKLWIVVFVFILLVSGLVSVFSNKEDLGDLESSEEGEELEHIDSAEHVLIEEQRLARRIEELKAKKRKKKEIISEEEEEDEQSGEEGIESAGEPSTEEGVSEEVVESKKPAKAAPAPPPAKAKKRSKDASEEEEKRLKELAQKAKRRTAEAAHDEHSHEEEDEEDEQKEKHVEEKVEEEPKEDQAELEKSEEVEASVGKPPQKKERAQKAKKVEKEEIVEKETEEKEEENVREEAISKKPLKPVKIFRTKGKTHEERIAERKASGLGDHEAEAEEEQDEEEEEEQSEHKHQEHADTEKRIVKKLPVKTFRTKGKTKEEILAARRAGLYIEEHEDGDEDVDRDEEETCESSGTCHQDEHPAHSAKTAKQPLKVRYTFKKGRDPSERLPLEQHVEEQDDDDENDEDEEMEHVKEKHMPKKPVIPIKVYKTKGGEKKMETPLKETEITHKPSAVEEKLEKRRQTTKAASTPAYKKYSITNREDNKIRARLDEADRLLDDRKLEDALGEYDNLLRSFSQSPRAHYGRAKTLDLLSELEQSNSKLEESIREYELVLDLPNVPEDLFVICAQRLVDRAQFRGWLKKALDAQRKLVDKFPGDLKILNEYGVLFLIMGRNDDSKKIFETVLVKDPDNGFALAHYGFILKTVDDKLEEGADFLRRGIATNEKGTQDGRFFFQLGDALQRLNRSDEAYEVYEEGAQKGFFLSKLQRSLYNEPGLTSRAWWTAEQTTYANYLKAIESEWRAIRDEGIALLDQKNVIFKKEDEKLTNKGDWRQLTLFLRGKKVQENCLKAPRTCALIEKFPDAISCTRGQIKFSVMEGGTRVWPHCGPTNCRLRGHLGLIVPPDPRIRVGNETRAWKRGKFIIFDDSFEHEVWYEGSGFRLILIVDFWHPELTQQQRTALQPI